MIELQTLGIALRPEKANDVGLLLRSEQSAAQLVARICAVAAKIAFHGIAQGCFVLALHIVEEFAEAPCHRHLFSTSVLGALLQFQHCGQHHRTDGSVRLIALSHHPAQALMASRTLIVETADVAGGYITHVDFCSVVCFHGFNKIR